MLGDDGWRNCEGGWRYGLEAYASSAAEEKLEPIALVGEWPPDMEEWWRWRRGTVDRLLVLDGLRAYERPWWRMGIVSSLACSSSTAIAGLSLSSSSYHIREDFEDE